MKNRFGWDPVDVRIVGTCAACKERPAFTGSLDWLLVCWPSLIPLCKACAEAKDG